MSQPSRRAYIALVALLWVDMLNLVDRTVPFIASEPLKRELHLSDVQLGMLGGIAFTLVYSVFAFPLSWLADRGFKKAVIVGCVATWSLLTSAGAFAASFSQLLLSRIGVAVGEGSTRPVSNALIASLFPARKLGLAIAIFGLSGGLATLMGRSVCSWLAASYGWRTMLLIMGPVGIASALFVLVAVPEPPVTRTRSRVSFTRAIAYVWRVRALRNLTLANVSLSAVLYTNQYFIVSFLMRVHGMSLLEVGFATGVIGGCASMCGRLWGGHLYDRAGRDDAGDKLRFATRMLLVCVPLYLAAWLVPSSSIAIGLIVLTYLAHDLPIAPQIASVQVLSPADMRSTVNAVYGLAGGLIGAGLGPLLAGYLSDLMAPHYGAASLRYSLAIMTTMFALTAVFVWRASKTFSVDLTSVWSAAAESGSL